MYDLLQRAAAHIDSANSPYRITLPTDIAKAQQLDRAGLAVVKLAPPSKGRSSYGEIELALIVSITDSGRQALALIR